MLQAKLVTAPSGSVNLLFRRKAYVESAFLPKNACEELRVVSFRIDPGESLEESSLWPRRDTKGGFESVHCSPRLDPSTSV